MSTTRSHSSSESATVKSSPAASSPHATPAAARDGDLEKQGVNNGGQKEVEGRGEKGKEAEGRESERSAQQWKIVTWNMNPTAPSDQSSKETQDLDPLQDPAHPQGWSQARRVWILAVTCCASMCVTCASSVVAACYQNLEREFNISETVAILGLSLFVLGLGLGPILIAPLSEFYGRRPIYLVSFGAFALLGLPVAFANNPAVFFIFRFITGFLGSAFLSVAGGTVADLFQAHEFFLPMAFYSASPFAGPEVGPMFSGFANYFTGSFRWSFWTITIWSAITWLLIFLFVPETFHPMILTKRARKIRKETGDESYKSQHEINYADKTIRQTLWLSSLRVPQLLALEPMLFLLCLWSALLLGIIYLLFEAYPIVFEQGHGFNLWQTGLSFLGIFVGMLCALVTMPFWSRLYDKEAARNDGKAPPEARLPPAMPGAFLTVIGLFIFAFTSYPHVHWIAPIISGIPFGMGVVLVFIAVFTFTTDSYRPVAASAMACNSVFRSSFAAAFPLFATPMYHKLGTVGASCLLAGLNVLMVPVPFLFYKYGARIRARSRFTLPP